MPVNRSRKSFILCYVNVASKKKKSRETKNTGENFYIYIKSGVHLTFLFLVKWGN